MAIVVKQLPAIKKGTEKTLDRRSCRFIASPLEDGTVGFLMLSWKQQSFEGWEHVRNISKTCTGCYVVRLSKEEIIEQMKLFYGKNVEIIWKD